MDIWLGPLIKKGVGEAALQLPINNKFVKILKKITKENRHNRLLPDTRTPPVQTK